MSKYKTKVLPAIAGVISLAVVAGIAASSFGTGGAPMQQFSDELAHVDTSHLKDITQGDDAAPITMIEYASHTCSHCATFHNVAYPQLKADYIDTGKVKLVTREVYQHKTGLWATMIARCDDAKFYHDINDDVFKTQGEWMSLGSGQEISDRLRQIGLENGLSEEKMKACLSDETEAMALLARSQDAMQKDGIRGTPTFVINGQVVSNRPYDKLKEVLDAELQKVGE